MNLREGMRLAISRELRKRLERQRDMDAFIRKYGKQPPPVQLNRPCGSYEASEIPGVCQECGRDAELHSADVQLLPYREAVWKWMLKYGGVPEYYGGYSQIETASIREHLEDCSVDTDVSGDPHMEGIETFDGTFSEERLIEMAVVGRLTCVCEQFEDVRWAVREGMTIGEVIFQVLKEGEDG